jgi:hypothetical protein
MIMNKQNLITLVIFITILFPGIKTSAQELFIPREFRAAIEKGTRTIDGKPGEKYWTNTADYKMDVKLEFKNDTTWIKGSADIKYHNNSPDKLYMLVLRSYPDFFGGAAIRNFYIYPVNETEQVQYGDMIVNKDTIPSQRVMMSRTSTNLIVRLNNPLEPGASADLKLSWKYYMHPSINIRQGVYENKSVFIAYWYPQLAVYDDVYGWDMVDYMGSVEFYNGFNNYDVSISVPAGYLVWAGGELQNAQEVYPEAIYRKLLEAGRSDEIVAVVSSDDLPVKHVGKEYITWKFRAEGTPDFTFAASRHHLWDASSIGVEPGRRVLVSAVYPPESKHYKEAAKISRKSIENLSFECPGVAYPWPAMTVFNSMEGGGGMESPMMVNNGDQGTLAWASEVIFHEISHSYFPFISGANERRFSWLDEGWATYKGITWSNGAPGTGKDQFDGVYQAVSGTTIDIPLMVPSYQIVEPSASTYYSYGRSAMALMTIEDQIGKDKMNLVWKTMIERWAGKHPQPWDFFAIINEIAGENMNWLIKPWYYDFAYADLGLEPLNVENKTISVRNTGGLPVPVYLTIEYEKGEPLEIYRKADVWINTDLLEIKVKDASKVKSVTLGNKILFDTDPTNNSWEIKK